MFSVKEERLSAIVSILDVITSFVALCGLLPIAGGLPSIATRTTPFADGIWFVINLCGPLLLLASGLRLPFRRVVLRYFVAAFAASVAILGTLRLQIAGFHDLLTGWLFLALFVGGLLYLLRRAARWALMGIVWCIVLLGAWSAGGIISFISAAAPQLPVFLLFQIAACVLALLLVAVHLRYRSQVDLG